MQSNEWPVIGICTVILVISGLILNQALSIPKGTFEPLGSAPVPIAVCVVLSALALCQFFASVFVLFKSRILFFISFNIRVIDVLLISLVILIYVYLIQIRFSSYGSMTSIILFSIFIILTRAKKYTLIPSFLISLALSYSLQWIFTRILFVNLPT